MSPAASATNWLKIFWSSGLGFLPLSDQEEILMATASSSLLAGNLDDGVDIDIVMTRRWVSDAQNEEEEAGQLTKSGLPCP